MSLYQPNVAPHIDTHDRLPVYGPHIERFSDPHGTYTKETSETVWAPTETSLGHIERYGIASPGVEMYLERYAGLEHLAAAGMRQTFERFGIHAALSGTSYEDPNQPHVELVKRSLSLAFPSHVQLKETVDNHAKTVQGATLRVTSCVGEFTLINQLDELSKGNLLLSAEQHPDDPDLTYFWGSYYMHDMLEHFPGWLSLPPELLGKLQACATEAAEAYKKHPPGAFTVSREADKANTRLVEVATIIDERLDIHDLGRFLTGGDSRFGKGMAYLLGGKASYYEKQLKEYIADHSDDDVLRIG
jgi:hypothetical protein